MQKHLRKPTHMTDLTTKAADFARMKHHNQLDDSGKPYFDAHIVQVVKQLEVITQDENILAAAYLHDTVEDTDTTYEELIEEFGQKVADLVMEVTHEGEKDNYGRWFPRLKTREGIMIKLADRNSNISRMDAWSEQRRQHYLKKTCFWKTKGPNENVL